MEGKSIIKQVTPKGLSQIWQIEALELGADGEIGVVKMYSLSQKNTIDGSPVLCVVPVNMFYEMNKAGIIEVYNKA